MTAAYNKFSAFVFELIEREGAARQNREHYTVKVNTFTKLRKLAAAVVDDTANLEEVNALQRKAVAFVLNVDAAQFSKFLNTAHGRYFVTNRFYPQAVEEFCYKRYDVESWVAETFKGNDDTEAEAAATDEAATDEAAAGEAVDDTPFGRYAAAYSALLRQELEARRLFGIHTVITADAFRTLRDAARAITKDTETYFDLKVRQQILISSVAVMQSVNAFNAFLKKASASTLEQLSQDILPVVEEYDPDADDDDADDVDDVDDVTTDATDATTDATTDAADDDADDDDADDDDADDDDADDADDDDADDADDDDATDDADDVKPVALWVHRAGASQRLFNALQARGGDNLVIARPDDEPLAVNVDALLACESFDARVALIAQVNDVDAATVVNLLFRAPLTFDDDPEPPTTTRPEHDDNDDDGGAYDSTEDDNAPTYDVTDDDADDEHEEHNPAPRWPRVIRMIFEDADKDIKAAHDKGGDNSGDTCQTRRLALREIFDIVAANRLTLRATYLCRNNHDASVNKILEMFFDGLNAQGVVEKKGGNVTGRVFRRVRLTSYRHSTAHTFVGVMSKGAVNWLYYAFKNGLTEEGREFPHVEITE